MKRFLLLLIGFYRKYVSPYRRACCRFEPTCSRYAFEAIERFGAAKGGYLALRRREIVRAGRDIVVPQTVSLDFGAGSANDGTYLIVEKANAE